MKSRAMFLLFAIAAIAFSIAAFPDPAAAGDQFSVTIVSLNQDGTVAAPAPGVVQSAAGDATPLPGETRPPSVVANNSSSAMRQSTTEILFSSRGASRRQARRTERASGFSFGVVSVSAGAYGVSDAGTTITRSKTVERYRD